MKNNLLPIAKEGWKYIGCSIILIFLFSFLDLGILEFFSYILFAFFIYIFRNPERQAIGYEQNSVVSPVDGKVISIQEINEKDFAYKLVIESSYFDVALLRAPFNATLISVDSKFGARLSKFSPLRDKLNETTTLILEDNNKNILKVQHNLKQTFSPIFIDVKFKQKLLHSSRYGLMLNGLTTIYLPQNFRINVNISDEVKASQSLVGYFS